MTDISTDFSLSDEYKEDPLVPTGTYKGNVTNVTFDPDQMAIVWDVVMEGNEGTMSDGETLIDGQVLFFRNWLPRKGDEDIAGKRGGNKRQTKINMLKKFAEKMDISMDTPTIIAEAIENTDWIGIPVLAKVSINEYEGNISNQINNMARDHNAASLDTEDIAPF